MIILWSSRTSGTDERNVGSNRAGRSHKAGDLRVDREVPNRAAHDPLETHVDD